jgi:DNA-binding winged helix-turn-helix (wHTH) protein
VRVVFGDCEFDSARRLVLRHGQVAPLSPKAFELLRLLLERRPEAASKEELLEHLWPGTFVTDASLHNLIAEIRDVVGDDARTARFIRTIPRYGYAFHGDARDAAGAVRSAPSTSDTGPRLLNADNQWQLSDGPNLLGRDADCVVQINSPAISRHHARIVVSGADVTLEDLDSKNGTYLNDRAIHGPVVIQEGDEIRVGSVTMTFRRRQAVDSTISLRRRGSDDT